MLILSGGIGCGKTTLLKRVILDNSLAVQGFLSLKIVEQGVVTGIKVLTLPWREEMFMATATSERTKLSTGRYAFRPETFQRIDERFERFDRCLPFVFDEFGILEMRGRAHFALFQRLAAARMKMLVVVRSELIEEFTGRYSPDHAMEVVDLERDANAAHRIMQYLQQAHGA
ncbi:MAG: nucleoside-triphosphatase [Desulfomonilia bacterium]|jgi:nucleoside-triphosphatase THEP1|nr:nucleoside-triphosphatase [Desulfomonilia bacterium]HPW69168.1 nucleoside-triphosphatase [Deltaproteobacteria bacterium]